MKNLIAAFITAPILLLAGCASTPEENSRISTLQQEIDNLDTSQQYAPIAVQVAQESLDKLKSLASDSSSSSDTSVRPDSAALQ